MATPRHIPVEKYLKTMYRPDREYVDGVVRERLWGERDHAWVQSNLLTFFGIRSHATDLKALPSLRFQTAPSRFRVPDVVITRGKPDEQILTKPPLLCVEILSPEDRMMSMLARLKEYLDFGVPVVWLIEPTERRIWVIDLMAWKRQLANRSSLTALMLKCRSPKFSIKP